MIYNSFHDKLVSHLCYSKIKVKHQLAIKPRVTMNCIVAFRFSSTHRKGRSWTGRGVEHIRSIPSAVLGKEMSIPYSGTFTRSGGLASAITKQLKTLSLKPVKRISYKFDPFQANEAKSIRWCMFYLSSAKIQDTNIRCTFKTDVVCDQSEPLIQVNLENGKQIIFKTAKLSELEIIRKFNEITAPLVPKEDDFSSKIPAKLAKKAAAGGKFSKSVPKKK